jgi:outer membrane biosynthesis protein TonB
MKSYLTTHPTVRRAARFSSARRACRCALLLALLGVTLTGCTKTRAQMPEPQPTLVVPPVPARTIDPPAVVEPPPEPPPADPPPPTSASKPKPTTRPSSESKPEAKPEPETVAAAPTTPAVTLRSAAAPVGPEAARQIREIIETSQKILDNLDSTQMRDDRKANFTQARNLLQQAEEHLRKEELSQARSFAERAQTIAKLLQTGR